MEKRDESKTRALMLAVAMCFTFLSFAVVPVGGSLTTAQAATTTVHENFSTPVAASVQTESRLMTSVDRVAPGVQATPGSGPEIKTQSEADAAQNKRKIVAGVLAAVLLGAVIWGRHIRKKRSKAEG